MGRVDTSQVVTEILRDHVQCREASESLLQATLEATIDGLLVIGRDGRITASNERFAALWRIPHELLDKGHDALLLEYVLDQVEDPAEFRGKVEELYANPERESFDVVRFNDGRVFERYSRPVSMGRTIIGRVWSFRDVTERERLIARQSLLIDVSRLLESLDVETALDALARRVLPYLGDACAIDLLERGEPRRVLAHALDPTRVAAPALRDEIFATRPALFEVGGESFMVVPLATKDVVSGALTFVASPPRQYTRADLEAAEDVAKAVALALENARLLREAQQALRARDELLSIAAHEIRGPLTSIHLAAEVLQGSEVAAETRERLLDVVVREDRRLTRFVDDLVEFGRIRTQTMRFDIEDIDLGDVVREVATRYSPELGRTNSTMEIRVAGPVIGRWDRFRIDQVVANLIDNAVKFGLGRSIEITVKAEDGSATLAVMDRGLGVTPEQLEHIFEPFGRGVSSRHYGGLGLGLFIVRTIVGRLGGTIHAESREGGGTSFVVELPQPGGP